MNPERLAEIKEMLAKITDLEAWNVKRGFAEWKINVPATEENARFIAAAPQIVKELLAEIERWHSGLNKYSNSMKCPKCGASSTCFNCRDTGRNKGYPGYAGEPM